MQTDQWYNYSQSNRTTAFIIEQKSLATARPFQVPNLDMSTTTIAGNVIGGSLDRLR